MDGGCVGSGGVLLGSVVEFVVVLFVGNRQRACCWTFSCISERFERSEEFAPMARTHIDVLTPGWGTTPGDDTDFVRFSECRDHVGLCFQRVLFRRWRGRDALC